MKEWPSTRVRPTCGIEFVRSRHFPEAAQGNFLFNNVIGFQGIKQYQRRSRRARASSAIEIEPLLQSTDLNFRPVALQFGPDGALYVGDWFNPLVGHMQYSLRDPRRDTSTGASGASQPRAARSSKPPRIDGRVDRGAARSVEGLRGPHALPRPPRSQRASRPRPS